MLSLQYAPILALLSFKSFFQDDVWVWPQCLVLLCVPMSRFAPRLMNADIFLPYFSNLDGYVHCIPSVQTAGTSSLSQNHPPWCNYSVFLNIIFVSELIHTSYLVFAKLCFQSYVNPSFSYMTARRLVTCIDNISTYLHVASVLWLLL